MAAALSCATTMSLGTPVQGALKFCTIALPASIANGTPCRCVTAPLKIWRRYAGRNSSDAGPYMPSADGRPEQSDPPCGEPSITSCATSRSGIRRAM